MNLRSYLAQEGMTQQKFAEQLGVTQGLVWQWLEGQTRLSLDWALKIEDATNGAVSVRDWPVKSVAPA